MSIQIKNILVRYWGYASFLPMQEDIINSTMEGRDTLALLPTGGGKSICFQVPALAVDGVCLVITPLIALMKDQVENLKGRGIKAAAVYSGMHREELEMAYSNAAFGDNKFLYLSPERLETERFRLALQKIKVNLIAVDEAHCISQWGYDFRPSYLKIADLRKHLPGVPVLALTATATPDVVEDIQDKLEFSKKNVFQKSFERKNLTYIVFKEEDKFGRLLRIVSKVPGSGIVYARNRRKTREIAEQLTKNRISADFYHAGLDVKTRDRKQNAWMKGKVRVMVATNAFGMGIDKPDVRFVVHLDLTDSLEAYFQEAGRGGRDQRRAYAVILFEEADLINAKHNLEVAYPEISMIKDVYKAIGNYLQLAVGSGKDASFDFDLFEFSRNFNFKAVQVYNSLKFLEREAYLQLNESFGVPSRVHFIMNREDLYRFQVEHNSYDNFIKLLLRSYSGVFTEYVKINEKELSDRSGHSVDEINKILALLQKNNVIDFVPRTQKPQITFLKERVDAKNVYFSPRTYRDRKKIALMRMQSVIDYVTHDTKCRSQVLLSYFGEKNTRRCGRCDVCLERNKVALNELEFDNILGIIKPMMQSHPCSIQEMVFDVKEHSEEMVIKVLRWLEDNGKVIRIENNLFRWRKQYKLKI